ncbi:MAG: 50S ribosomal protein L13 [Desulfohalobiaceae bacterium]
MNTYKTRHLKPSEQCRNWYVVDARNQVLGRLSSKLATKLRGKDKVDFTPHVDNGDFIVVINADKIRVTGNKLEDKKYYRHTGYPGGLKEMNLKKMLQTKPERAIYKAVKNMLPKNRLGRAQLKKLKIYSGTEHPHQAQKPSSLEL